MKSGIITVIGSLNADLVLPSSRVPSPGETLTGGDFLIASGGKGANQACAVARLGGHSRMVGSVGPDAFGKFLIESLQSDGVDVTRVRRSDRPTGLAAILVLPGGENCIIVSPGANAAVTPAIAAAEVESLTSPSLVLLQLEIPLESVYAAAEAAKRIGATVILDPAPAAPVPGDLLRSIDILTPNQHEAAALLGRPDRNIDSLDDAAAAGSELLAMGARTVILKLGELGCVVVTPQRTFALAGHKVAAVDTTAAGDTFNGALAVALSEGASLEDAAAFANAAAALSVTRRGAQPSIPLRQEVESFLGDATAHRAGSAMKWGGPSPAPSGG